MATEPEVAPSRRTLRFGLPVVVGLFVAAALVSYVGTRGGEPPTAAARPPEPAPAGPVVSIDLPHEEVALPPGPHREQFVVSCTVCHSPRLALTQPLLPEKKWAEVVHKMVAAYGAPVTAEHEKEVVTYLAAVHGKP